MWSVTEQKTALIFSSMIAIRSFIILGIILFHLAAMTCSMHFSNIYSRIDYFDQENKIMLIHIFKRKNIKEAGIEAVGRF